MRLIVAIITSLFIAYALLGGEFPNSLQYALVFVLVGVIGMAHGSIDHIIAKDVLKIVPRNSKIIFIAIYLGIIALYIGLWFISPLISFILFILYSAFHFGQADTALLANKLNKTQFSLLGLNYGLLVIAAMVFFNPIYTSSICPDWFVKILPKKTLVLTFSSIFYSSLVGLFLQVLTYTLLKKITWIENLLFAIQFTFVMLSFILLPPLVAFSVYFGLWHALLVLKREYFEVSQIKVIKNIKEFIWALTPFTLISLSAMILIIYWGSATAHFTSIVAISVLAFPHTLLMHLLYRKQVKAA